MNPDYQLNSIIILLGSIVAIGLIGIVTALIEYKPIKK